MDTIYVALVTVAVVYMLWKLAKSSNGRGSSGGYSSCDCDGD